MPLQAAVLTGFKAVSTRSSLFLNTNDKHLLIKIVQTGTKKSAVNVSKLQGKKGSWTSWPRTIASEKSVVLFSACQTKSIPIYHIIYHHYMGNGFGLLHILLHSTKCACSLHCALKKSEDFFKTLIDQIINVVNRYNAVFPFSLYSFLWSA